LAVDRASSGSAINSPGAPFSTSAPHIIAMNEAASAFGAPIPPLSTANPFEDSSADAPQATEKNLCLKL
jgi:hypothetical protein